MYKFISFFSSLLLLFTVITQTIAAQSSWTIEKYSSDIALQKNGEIQITETISTDFGTDDKHGIFRDLPYVYQTTQGDKKYTDVTVTKVLRDGVTEAYSLNKNESHLRIKIGNADKTISGKHTYSLHYIVKGVIVSYDTYDELYWNVTGNDWDAPILQAEASFTLPRPGIIQTACYFGVSGSTSQCRDQKQNDSLATFSTDRLSPQEGMTIAVGFQKGIVPILQVEKPKSFFEQLLEPLPILVFMVTTLLGVGYIVAKWYRQGRDFWHKNMPYTNNQPSALLKPLFSHETIVVEFTPPAHLRPAEMGVLIDEHADTLDITATLIDLAQRGYMTIEELKKTWVFGKADYRLNRTKKNTGLLPYENELLERLLPQKTQSILISSLKLTFYDDLKKVKEMLYENMAEKKFFLGNPDKIRQKYLIIGFLLTFLPIFLFSIAGFVLVSPILVAFAAGVILTGLNVFLFSRFMSRRTAEGRNLYRRSLGYKLFISGAEQYRQQFFEKHNLFNEILPYTIIFGLTEKFAQAMKDMGVEPTQPTWYHGYTPFNTVAFTNSMNSFSKSLSSVMAASPSSSGSGGGGSSGGGFGGGGGGSW